MILKQEWRLLFICLIYRVCSGSYEKKQTIIAIIQTFSKRVYFFSIFFFPIQDTDKSGNIDLAEFQQLMIQMKQPVQSIEETSKLMVLVGAKTQQVFGGTVLVLYRDDLISAVVQHKVNQVLGNEWVEKAALDRAKTSHISMLLFLLFLCHAPISQRICEFFSCHTIGEKNLAKDFLRDDYNMECWTGEHGSFAVIVVFFLVVFTLAFPLIILSILCKKRKILYTPKVQRNYGFLYNRFSKGAEMWEIHELFRKLILMGALIFCQSTLVLPWLF